jgi:hypothetical protein
MESFGQPGTAVSGWLTLDWFFLPHSDLRVDGIYQTLPSSLGNSQALTLLAQLHTYL